MHVFCLCTLLQDVSGGPEKTFLCHLAGSLEWLLSPKGQALATWLYLLLTAAVLFFIFLQVKAMRRTAELETFKKFCELWDDREARTARQYVYNKFIPASEKAEKDRATEPGKLCEDLKAEDLRQFDTVIYRSNLVGMLWAEKFFSRKTRKRVMDYIYKTVVLTWDCLHRYVEFVRRERGEDQGEVTYALPFEQLAREAEKRLGKQPRPKPSKF